MVEEEKVALEPGADLKLKVKLKFGVVQGLKAASDSGADLELKVVELGAGREPEAIVAAELRLIGPTGCYILPQIRQNFVRYD